MTKTIEEEAQEILGGELGIININLDDPLEPPEFTGLGGTINYQGIAAGTYIMTLKAVRKDTKKNWKTKELEPALCFEYEEKKSGRRVLKKVTPSAHERSNCFKLIRGMNGNDPPPEVLLTKESYWNYCKSFIGQDFIVSLSLSPDGHWNNIETIMPPLG